MVRLVGAVGLATGARGQCADAAGLNVAGTIEHADTSCAWLMPAPDLADSGTGRCSVNVSHRYSLSDRYNIRAYLEHRRSRGHQNTYGTAYSKRTRLSAYG